MRIGIIPRGVEWKNRQFSCTFGKAMKRIPSFLLYGEQPEGAEPPFVHIETIASRSRALDWRIGAHRHDALSHVLLIRGGGGRFQLDGVERSFGPASVLSVPSKMVHGFDFVAETDGLVLTLSDSLLSLARGVVVEAELAGELAGPMLIDFAEDPGGFAQIADALGRIGVELAQPRIGQMSAIRSLIALVLLVLARAGRFHAETSPYSSHDLRLVEKLRRRIGADLTQALTVAALAAELGVTPARLNAACRRVAGCSSLHLMHAALLAEAKRALLYTEQPVCEVAYSLGFEDPAYFSRFFTRRTGRTPSAFRAQHIPAG
jgi:AraC family transcriptional activator of pobA